MNTFMLKAGVATMALTSVSALALEISPGDYELLPDGKTAVLTYLQASHSDSLYADDKRLAGDNKLSTQSALLRVIHAWHPQENWSIEPQAILPFASVKAYGDMSFLGDASGSGDLIIGAPVKYAPDGKNVWSLAPFIYLPTGSYSEQDAINIGSNNFHLLLQAVWIHHFSDKLAFDTAADVSWATDNNDFGANSSTLSQDARFEYQAYLRYHFSPLTHIGFGGGWISGGETKVDGVAQNDRLDTVYARASVTHFVTPNWQVQLSAGRDISVTQGFKQDANVSLRLGYIF
ncbi:transporter [Vibrio sp. CDRSL-10 TSBA]